MPGCVCGLPALPQWQATGNLVRHGSRLDDLLWGQGPGRGFLKTDLALNPGGIDPSYFYSEYLAERDRLNGVRVHPQTALKAPSLRGRDFADNGRHREIKALLTNSKRNPAVCAPCW